MPLSNEIKSGSHILFSISLIQDQPGKQDAQTGEEFNRMADDLISHSNVQDVTLMLADTLQRHRITLEQGIGKKEAIEKCKELLVKFLVQNKAKIIELKKAIEARGGKFRIIDWDIVRGCTGSHEAFRTLIENNPEIKEILDNEPPFQKEKVAEIEEDRKIKFKKAQKKVKEEYAKVSNKEKSKKNTRRDFHTLIDNDTKNFAQKYRKFLQSNAKIHAFNRNATQENQKTFLLEECAFLVVAAEEDDKHRETQYDYEFYIYERNKSMECARQSIANTGAESGSDSESSDEENKVKKPKVSIEHGSKPSKTSNLMSPLFYISKKPLELERGKVEENLYDNQPFMPMPAIEQSSLFQSQGNSLNTMPSKKFPKDFIFLNDTCFDREKTFCIEKAIFEGLKTVEGSSLAGKKSDEEEENVEGKILNSTFLRKNDASLCHEALEQAISDFHTALDGVAYPVLENLAKYADVQTFLNKRRAEFSSYLQKKLNDWNKEKGVATESTCKITTSGFNMVFNLTFFHPATDDNSDAKLAQSISRLHNATMASLRAIARTLMARRTLEDIIAFIGEFTIDYPNYINMKAKRVINKKKLCQQGLQSDICLTKKIY